MNTHDKQGRPWAKLSELKEGDTVVTDEGFSCLPLGQLTVRKNKQGLYIDCNEGCHYLDEQAGGGQYLVGIYKV